MGLSVQEETWCGLTTDLNPCELNIFAPCCFPRKGRYGKRQLPLAQPALGEFNEEKEPGEKIALSR